jgi:arylsulfatase A-like enzyme
MALFRCRSSSRNRTMLYYSASRLLPTFVKQLRTARTPFFGFVNLIDVHDPYVPDPQIYPPEQSLPAKFAGDVLSRTVSSEIAHPEIITDAARRHGVEDKLRLVPFPSLVTIDLSAETLDIYHKRYLAKARGLDRALATFFRALEAEGLLENTAVIITSDHGESFGEADLITHNFHDRGDYESTHHVPLIVLLPRTFTPPRERRITRRVSIADIAPTIYDLAGINWQPLARAFPPYAQTLLPTIAARTKARTTVALPAPLTQDHSKAEQERLRALRALGYLQ